MKLIEKAKICIVLEAISNIIFIIVKKKIYHTF